MAKANGHAEAVALLEARAARDAQLMQKEKSGGLMGWLRRMFFGKGRRRRRRGRRLLGKVHGANL